MQPLGKFGDCDIDEWSRGVEANFTGPLRFLHKSMTVRNMQNTQPTVIFFAGGGTNSSPKNVSSYTTSKIALIKAVELLDEEYADTKFTILGPGWINTKIHEEVLNSRFATSESKLETKRRLSQNDFNNMTSVVEFCDWLVQSPKKW